MEKGVRKKKESYASKLANKKKLEGEKSTGDSETDSSAKKTTGCTSKDKTSMGGETVSGSKSMVVSGHGTKGSDITNMAKTCFSPKNQESRAFVAIHGSYPTKKLDHQKLPESVEEEREVSSAAATSSASNPVNDKRPPAESSHTMKESKAKSKSNEKDKSTRVIIKEQDPTPKGSKLKMSMVGDGANVTATDLSNPISEKEQSKKMDYSQTSKSVDTKVSVSGERQQDDTKDPANSSNELPSTNVPVQSTSEGKRLGNGEASSGDLEFSSSQTSQSNIRTKESGGTGSITAKRQSKKQMANPKSSNSKLNDITKQDSASFESSNLQTSPSPQSVSDNQSIKTAEADDQGEENFKHPPRNIYVNPTKREITDLEVDVIVSSEDAALQGYGMVAKQLTKKGGERYKQHKQMAYYTIGGLKEWHFIFTPGAGSLKCKGVAHVNIPRMQEFDQDTWCSYFTKLMDRLLKRVDCMGFRSMVIPLLGTGRNGAPTSFVSELICNRIQDFSKKPTDKIWLQTIYIVHPDKSIVKSIETVAKQQHLFQTPEVTKSLDVSIGKSKTNKSHIEKDVRSFIEIYSVKPETVKSVAHEEQCPICMDKIESKERVELNKCHHVFCLMCIRQTFAGRPSCPICNIVYGIVRGIQPWGCMVEVFRKESLPGFDGCGVIHIYYAFPDGIQDEKHPNPGKRYRGTKREAFLPDNTEGQRVHRLLRRSFEQKLTFTIGSSRTTGREDVVTWNDIHHKTRMNGGPERYGYPDPLYLKRVEEELAAKGISEETDSSE